MRHALVRALRTVAHRRPEPAAIVSRILATSVQTLIGGARRSAAMRSAPSTVIAAPRPRSVVRFDSGRYADLAPRSAAAGRLAGHDRPVIVSMAVPARERTVPSATATATLVEPGRRQLGEQLTLAAAIDETTTPTQLGPIRPIDLPLVAASRIARGSQARPSRPGPADRPSRRPLPAVGAVIVARIRPALAAATQGRARGSRAMLGDRRATLRSALASLALRAGTGTNRERILPIGVAALVLVASILSVRPAVGEPAAIGNVTSAGEAPRLVIGGGTADVGGTDGYGPLDPYATSDGNAGLSRALAAEPAADPLPNGPYAMDGTLLKPVAVDTSVPDGAAQLRSYKVRSGDTLVSIAARFKVSMMTVWWANDLASKTDLHIGQTLVIPPITGTVVTVGPADTLGSIAAASGVDQDVIMAYNGLTDSTLVLGQVLIVPGGQGAAIATPAPKPTPRPAVRAATRHVSAAPARYTGGRLAWPVPGGYISQYFHPGHYAIDIAGPYGSPIVAAAAGVVTFAGWKNNGGGYQVWISHGSNLYTTYNHMSSVAVGVGQRVGRGQFVGRVGMTGDATGPHCHFEVWIGPIWNGGTRVNPLAYL